MCKKVACSPSNPAFCAAVVIRQPYSLTYVGLSQRGSRKREINFVPNFSMPHLQTAMPQKCLIIFYGIRTCLTEFPIP